MTQLTIWDELKHFNAHEFDYPNKMNPSFLRKIDRVRDLAGVPMYPESDYRPGDNKSHGKGLAGDFGDTPKHVSGVDVSSRWRFKVVLAALKVGFNRIGVYDKHIHLDDDRSLPKEVLWWGVSS